MASVALTPETTRRLEALFRGNTRQLAEDLLITRCGDTLPFHENASPQDLERIRFAVLKLSNGDFAELERAVAVANSDWRDVLVAAGFGDDPLIHSSWFPSREE